MLNLLTDSSCLSTKSANSSMKGVNTSMNAKSLLKKKVGSVKIEKHNLVHVEKVIQIYHKRTLLNVGMVKMVFLSTNTFFDFDVDSE